MDAPKHANKSTHFTSAVASVEAEGFEVDGHTIRQLEKYADGQLTTEQLRAETTDSLRNFTES